MKRLVYKVFSVLKKLCSFFLRIIVILEVGKESEIERSQDDGPSD